MRPKTAEDLEKRVKCLLCEALFSTKGNMDKHIRKIHRVLGYVPGDPSTAFGPKTTEQEKNSVEQNNHNIASKLENSSVTSMPTTTN